MALLSDCVSARIDLDGLVNGVVTKLERRLNKPGIFILAPPGCSRGRLVTVLLRRGLVDVVYAYGGFGSKVGDDVRGRVNEFGSIDELVGKLGSVNGRVAVVARSTTDAIRLRDRLGNAEVIYLPKYYEDAAKEVLSGGAPGVAGVRHEGLGEGISPSMLREGVPSEVVESIRKLSPGRLGLRDLIKDFLKKASRDTAAQAITLGLSFLFGAGVAVSLAGSLAGRFVEMVVDKWRKNRDEAIGGFVRLVGVAREVRKYLSDERFEWFEAVVDEVAYEWGLGIGEFTNTITNIANITAKQLTDEDIKKIINDKLERIEKELNEIKTKVEGLLVGAKVFFIYDVESGLLYGNFTVKDGVPRIKTQLGTAKNELETDLVDVGKFREVAEDVFNRLTRDGRVVLVGPRGIGKSTLATYVAWRSLLGSLGKVALNEQLRDAVIRVDSLNPGDAVELNNLIKTAGRRFVVIYDPSPIKAYYKPEAMQVVKHGIESTKKTTLKELIESVENTLRELMEVGNAWVVIILPRELYDEVQRAGERDVDLRRVLNNLERDVVMVNLRDGEFLREVIRKYSGCDDVSDDLVKRVMGFDSYTLVAKYVGIWLRERVCNVEDVDEALRESAGEPKLFFAHYIWGIILGKSMDLARRVSVPLILHAALGPIPEGVTYITKAVKERGFWRLVSINRLAKSELEDLREDDLEPIAKWLSIKHEDLIEETLKELAGLQDKEARNNYRNHGFENFIKALDWGYEKALEEGRKILGLWFGEIAPGESSAEEFMKNLVKKLEQLTENEDELKEVVEHDQRFLATIYQQLLTAMEALPEETKAEINSLLNLGINLSVFVSTRLAIALKPLTNCWKRAALIIGYALTGHVSVPRPEGLPEDVRESIKGALDRCGVDDYLLVGDVIPPLIMGLAAYTRVSTEAIIDRYNEAVAEVRRILNIARGRGSIHDAEKFYGLGLASIIANAAWLDRVFGLGKVIKPDDADDALHIVTFTIKGVVSPILIMPILSALRPLCGKAPHRYIELLAFASDMENLDSDTVRYIFDGLNEVLDKYGDVVRGYAWSLVHAITAYANLLWVHRSYFNREEVGDVVGRVVGLLNELDKLSPSLGIIAWAHALAPALRHEDVRGLMEEKLGINVVDEAGKVLEKLNNMRERIQELMGDKEFMGYVESKSVKADEEAVKKVILDASSFLKHALAHYRFDNDELKEAEDLFNEAAEENKEIGVYENYLTNHGWVLRVEAIKGSLAGNDLVNLVKKFQQLYEETFSKEHFKPTAPYLSTASGILGGYLVSLALTGDDKKINELLEEHWWVLNAVKHASVLTRLMLNALLGPKVKLSGELEGRLSVNPEELINAFGSRMYSEFLPALRVALGIAKPENVGRMCMSINDSIKRMACMHAISVAMNDGVAVVQLRGQLIDAFRGLLFGKLGLLKELGVDVDALLNEFMGLVNGFDGKSLVQLIAPANSIARLALMLRALINGDKELAKAHALIGAVGATYSSKLLSKLFLETYKECKEYCDLGKDEFRRAIAKPFFYHV